MDNWCAICGEPIEGGKLTCDNCAVFTKDLTPEQKRTLEKIQADCDSREALIESMAAVRTQIAELIDYVLAAIKRIVDAIIPMLNEEEEDGQQG